jgi:hypothetical protein
MAVKKPPFSHREMARLIFNFESNKYSLATRLKVEAYTLFFTVLPHLIAAAIWVVILAAGFWAVTLI